MNAIHIIHYWKDPECGESLDADQQANMPESPVGLMELDSADLETVAGRSGSSRLEAIHGREGISRIHRICFRAKRQALFRSCS